MFTHLIQTTNMLYLIVMDHTELIFYDDMNSSIAVNCRLFKNSQNAGL